MRLRDLLREYVAIPLLICFLASCQRSHSVGVVHTSKASQIGHSVYKFLTDNMVERHQPADTISCDNANRCALNGFSSYPSEAWRLLAMAGEYSRTRSKDSLANLNRSFNHLVELDVCADALQPVFNAHQVAEAFRVSNDPKILNYFLRLVGRGLIYEQTCEGQSYSRDTPMLSAALLHSIFDAIDLLSDKRVLKVIDASSSLESQVPWLQQEGVAGFEALRNYIDGQKNYSPADHCYLAWAAMAGYNAKASASLLSNAKEFFTREDFTKYSKGDYDKFGVTQNLTPCLEALTDLSNLDSSFGSARDALAGFLVDNQWDDPEKHICRGDGGFFPSIIAHSDHDDFCLRQSKVAADNAWLSHAFNRF